jgi:hypothetical protein
MRKKEAKKKEKKGTRILEEIIVSKEINERKN